MKLRTYILIALVIGLPVLLCVYNHRSSPVIEKKETCPIDNTQVELIEKNRVELTNAQENLANAQSVIKKMEADMAEMQGQTNSMKDQLEKTKTQLKSTLQAFKNLQLQTDALTTELKTTKAKMNAISRNRDELTQQVRSLTKEKNSLITMITAASPSAAPKPKEEIKKDPIVVKPSQNASLAIKLQEAESFIGAGNWPAAERVLGEIRAIDANYPGLDVLNSRIQNLKSRLNGSMQPSQNSPIQK